MFTSEAELQWCLKVGREALKMIMCFIFFFLFYYPTWWSGGGETEQAAGRTSDDWNGFWVDVHDELGEKVHTDLLSLRGRITTQVSHWPVARVTDMTSDVLTAMELLCVVSVGQWHQWLASWDEGVVKRRMMT